MNILIIRFSALGDLVTLEPTFRAIRYFYATSRITMLTSSIGKDLYIDSKYFDDFIVFDDFNSTKEKVRHNVWNLVFNLHCNSLSHKIVFFSRCEKLVNISSNWFQKLLNIKISGKSIEKQILESGIDQLIVNDYFNDKNSKIISLPYVSPKEVIRVNLDKKIVALSTGSSERWFSKKWGVFRYAELIGLLNSHNIEVVLIGSRLELEDEKIILDKVGYIKSYVNKTTLFELKNILAQVDLFIGNDSGPAHIAAAVGTKTLILFGSTDIQHSPKFGNYSGEHFYIKPSNKIVCHPCYKQICPTNMECMEDMTVKQVLAEVLSVLGEK